MLCYENAFFWSTSLTYSPFMKNTLTNLFDNDSINTNFCGQKDYILEGNSTDDIIIFNSKTKTFPTDKYIHCHYVIDPKNKFKNEPYIYFQILKNDQSNEARTLKFEIFNLYTDVNEHDKIKISAFSHSDLRPRKQDYINLRTVDIIEIFFDFTDKNYKKPDELLQIKIFYNNKAYKAGESGESDEDEVNNGNSSKLGTIGGSIGGALIVIVAIVAIAYCFCSNRQANETYVVQRIA